MIETIQPEGWAKPKGYSNGMLADGRLYIGGQIGWNAAPEDVEPRYGRVSEAQQARYLPLAYQRVIDEWPWVGVANTWYLKRATDEWEREGKPEAYFRLLQPDFTPLPVYASIKEFATSPAQGTQP